MCNILTLVFLFLYIAEFRIDVWTLLGTLLYTFSYLETKSSSAAMKMGMTSVSSSSKIVCSQCHQSALSTTEWSLAVTTTLYCLNHDSSWKTRSGSNTPTLFSRMPSIFFSWSLFTPLTLLPVICDKSFRYKFYSFNLSCDIIIVLILVWLFSFTTNDHKLIK